MNVIARFKVTQKTETECGFEIVLEAVTGEREENKQFFKYTPSGTLKMAIVLPEVAEAFTVGHEYNIDFSKVIQN